MPTVTVDATLQGQIGNQITSPLINWLSQVRNATTGTFADTKTSNSTVNPGFSAALISGRGGSQFGSAIRVFLFFDDLDTETSGGTITAATLKIYNGLGTATSSDSIIIEASAWGSNGTTTSVSTSDFSNIDFSTAYSSTKLSWSGGYNDYALNATAIADMNSNGYLNCALIESDFDYEGDSPSLGKNELGSIEFLDPSNPIKIELTYSAAGYSNNVLGVAAANIGKINGVATANIGKVVGIS